MVLNIYVTYFLMLSTSKLSGIKISKKRMLLTSVMGGMYSLTILFEITLFEQVLLKLLMGISLVVIGYYQKYVKLWQLLRVGIYFIMVNFIYGGVMLSIFIMFAPKSMAYKNGVVYFNITALNLTISTIIAYLIVNILIRMLDKKVKTEELTQIRIKFLGREVYLIGLIDTGNKLNDIFTGLPVIVCEYNCVKELFPVKVQEYFRNMDTTLLYNTSYASKLRLVPINVVGSQLVLPAFKPDLVIVGEEEKEFIVAVTDQNLSNGEFNAII